MSWIFPLISNHKRARKFQGHLVGRVVIDIVLTNHIGLGNKQIDFDHRIQIKHSFKWNDINLHLLTIKAHDLTGDTFPMSIVFDVLLNDDFVGGFTKVIETVFNFLKIIHRDEIFYKLQTCPQVWPYSSSLILSKKHSKIPV